MQSTSGFQNNTSDLTIDYLKIRLSDIYYNNVNQNVGILE